MKLGHAAYVPVMLLGFYGCANQTQRDLAGQWGMELTQVRDKFACPDLQNSGLCAERFARKFEAAHPGLVRRDMKGRPQVKLRNGAYFSFSSLGEDTDDFSVLELQAKDRFAVIHQQFYEGNSWQLLDLGSGKLTEVYGYPLFSPDSTRFVAASEDLEAGYSDNVFDVYEVGAISIQRVFRAVSPEKPEWAGRNVRWDGKDVIRFILARYTGNPPTGFDENPAYLAFQNGSWSIHGDKAQ